jgi:hypothetical protein
MSNESLTRPFMSSSILLHRPDVILPIREDPMRAMAVALATTWHHDRVVECDVFVS